MIVSPSYLKVICIQKKNLRQKLLQIAIIVTVGDILFETALRKRK